MDIAVGLATAILVLLDARLLLSGCRHWYWLDPADFSIQRDPFTLATKPWGWTFELFRLPSAPNEATRVANDDDRAEVESPSAG